MSLQLSRLEAFLEEIERYLLSQEVFWPLDARGAKRDPSQTRLTVGNVLLLQDSLGAAEGDMTASEVTRWRRCRDAWGAVLLTWRSAVEKKAARELRARLRLWEAYLEDIEQGQRDRADYATEVRNRALACRLVDLLLPAGEMEPAIRELDALDRRLRAFFQFGGFVWPPYMRGMYPRDRFWFLYGQLQERSDATRI